MFKSDNEIDKLKWALWKRRLTESQQTRIHLKDEHQILPSFYFSSKKYLLFLSLVSVSTEKVSHKIHLFLSFSVLIYPFSNPLEFLLLGHLRASQMVLVVKNPPASARDAWDKGVLPELEDLLGKGMATPSSILAWRIPWTEEPGRLQFIGSQRVGYNWSDLAPTHTGHLNLTSYT